MTKRDTGNVQMRWGVPIALRDGVKLNATCYLPRDLTEPRPCILLMTPYIADTHHERGTYFASQGLPCVLVDARGRGNSEGNYIPYRAEPDDGYDVVEWIAKQPFCNGKVAMSGHSYCGYNQWATARRRPPHLATIVPTGAPCIGVDVPLRNNIFHPYKVRWLALISGRAAQTQIMGDEVLWSTAFRQWHEAGIPFARLDDFVGNPSAVFQEWVSHPHQDDYWDSLNPSPEEYAKIDMPVLTVTGIYDGDQPGALEHYRRHLRFSPGAKDTHYLIIGPWDHGGSSWSECPEFVGLRIKPETDLNKRKLYRDWYAWTLLGGGKPTFLRKPVAYYVMVDDCWRYADSLESITSHHKAFYLDSTRNADSVFHSGVLGDSPREGEPDRFTYDPRISGPEVATEANTPGTATEQETTFALAGKQLVYHSEPFEEDAEISGFFRLSAYISIDCPDTDLYVAVYDVKPDGSSVRLSTDAIRARYRKGLRHPEFVSTAEPELYNFDRFTFVSRKVSRGHRLRLVVAPIGRLVGTHFTERNFNGDKAVALQDVSEARAVTVRLYHDRSHQSVLHVPIARPRGGDEEVAPLEALVGQVDAAQGDRRGN